MSRLPESQPHRSRENHGGFLVGALFFILVVTAVVALAWMILLPRFVAEVASRATGCSVTISQLHANPFTGRFEINGLVVGNPLGWGDDALAEVSHLSGRVALGSLTDRTLIVEEAKAEISRVAVVVDATGKTNFEAIGPRLTAASHRSDAFPRYATAGLPALGEGPSGVLVRNLHLRLGRIEVIDRGVQPAQVLADNLEFQSSYENVSSYEQLITPQLMGRLAKSPALWQILITNGLLGGGDASKGGLQQLWQRAGGGVNSFLQGLEQTEKP